MPEKASKESQYGLHPLRPLRQGRGHDNNNSSKIRTTEESIKARKEQTLEDQVLQFMTENKRILNVPEKTFFELENFQANTTVFQTNINATLRN